MARVWKMKSGKWIVEVRKKGYPYISKAFWDLKVARKFGRDVESKMERNVFEDYLNTLDPNYWIPEAKPKPKPEDKTRVIRTGITKLI